MKESLPSSPITSWCSPPDVIPPGREQVHVWRVTLNPSPSCFNRYWEVLTTDERERAARFHFQKDRNAFVAARGQLRILLSRYLDIEPDHLRFCYSAYGKPSLAKEWHGERLRFNLSHSHGLALFAVTENREVGIDIEFIRPDFACHEVAQRFFSAREIATLQALPETLRVKAFFNCWTRKEAYIKARGEGLSLALDQFDVSLAPEEPAALLGVQAAPGEVARWSLQDLTTEPEYCAALAVEGGGWNLHCWQLQE